MLAMAASSNTQSANATQLTQDETTTESEEVTEEPTEAEGAETTAEAGDEASVSMSDQTTDGTIVTVDSATLPDGGFVTIHDSTLLDGDALGSVVGVSRYLEPGTHENVEIVLERPVDESQALIAMPHYDTNGNEVYGFIISAGETDGPYVDADGEVVVDDASITLESELETTEAPVETTEVSDEDGEADEPAETTEAPVETTEEPALTTEEPVETTEEFVETPEAPGEAPEVRMPDQLVFSIEDMQIDEWSFVVGDSTEPDRTETVEGFTVQDRTVRVNLTELMHEDGSVQDAIGEDVMGQEVSTETPEVIGSDDLETVRVVVRDVNVQNVTFIVELPEDLEQMPEPGAPIMTTEEPVETTEEPVLTTEEPVETTEVVTEEPVETTEELTEEPVETTEELTEEPVETTEVVTEEPVETTEELTEEPAETEEPADEVEALEFSEIDAPGSAVAGDTITVSATVTNPSDAAISEDVDFRLQGDVVDTESVELEGGESTTVTFDVDTTDLPTGVYVHGIYGEQRGQVAIIEITAEEEGTTTEEANLVAVPVYG